jgi:hypothetical protein
VPVSGTYSFGWIGRSSVTCTPSCADQYVPGAGLGGGPGCGVFVGLTSNVSASRPVAGSGTIESGPGVVGAAAGSMPAAADFSAESVSTAPSDGAAGGSVLPGPVTDHIGRP